MLVNTDWIVIKYKAHVWELHLLISRPHGSKRPVLSLFTFYSSENWGLKRSTDLLQITNSSFLTSATYMGRYYPILGICAKWHKIIIHLWQRHWRRKWQPTTLGFLPGKSHGQRSLVDCNPRGHKESDTTEQLNNNNRVIAVLGCIIWIKGSRTKEGMFCLTPKTSAYIWVSVFRSLNTVIKYMGYG